MKLFCFFLASRPHSKTNLICLNSYSKLKFISSSIRSTFDFSHSNWIVDFLEFASDLQTHKTVTDTTPFQIHSGGWKLTTALYMSLVYTLDTRWRDGKHGACNYLSKTPFETSQLVDRKGHINTGIRKTYREIKVEKCYTDLLCCCNLSFHYILWRS